MFVNVENQRAKILLYIIEIHEYPLITPYLFDFMFQEKKVPYFYFTSGKESFVFLFHI